MSAEETQGGRSAWHKDQKDVSHCLAMFVSWAHDSYKRCHHMLAEWAKEAAVSAAHAGATNQHCLSVAAWISIWGVL